MAANRLDWRDGLIVVGLGSLLYGVQQWSAPAAWVLFGVVLVAVWLRPYLRKE